MLGIERLPVLMDLAYGIDGMWAGTKRPKNAPEGMVIPLYFPANTLNLVKPKEYPALVPREAIVGPTEPSSLDVKGRASQVVVITNTADNDTPLLDQLDVTLSERLNDMRRRMEEYQWRAKDEERRRRDVQDDMEQEKRDKQKRQRGSRPSRPDFLGEGGRM